MSDLSGLPDRIEAAILSTEVRARQVRVDRFVGPAAVALAGQVLRAAEVDRRYLAYLDSHHDQVQYADEPPSGQCESPDCETPDGTGGWPCQGWLDLAERYGVAP